MAWLALLALTPFIAKLHLMWGKRPNLNSIQPGHSIALWVTSSMEHARQDVPEIQLHVNLWRLEAAANGLEFSALDLGIMVLKAGLDHTVSLYLPFTVNAAAVIDLAKLLQTPEIAVAIFNENVRLSPTAGNVSEFIINIPDPLTCWKIASNEINFSPVNSERGGIHSVGTILTFDSKVFASSSSDQARYVRLRIKLDANGLEAFFTKYDPVDRGLLSGFDEIEVVDFRFNEKRNLPKDVVRQMDHLPNVTQINYFVIRGITEDLILFHQDPKKSRTLESSVWTKYVYVDADITSQLRNAIIYYWKSEYKSGGFKDFNALSKFRNRKTGLRSIVAYVAWALAIGAVGGWISTALPSLESYGSAAGKALGIPRGTPDLSQAHRASPETQVAPGATARDK